MILWRGKAAGAHSGPVPNAIHAFGDAAPLCLESHPRFARRAVNIKWLAALLLMAVVAILMLGAVWTSLGWGLSVATAPVLFRRATADSDMQRADRLAPVARPQERDVMLRHIEALADDAQSLTPFTYVMVRLAQVADHPPAPKTPVEERTASAPGLGAPAKHDRARTTVAAAFAADGTLPPEIRFGASRPALPAHATAYADDEASPAPTLPGVPINLSVIAKSASAAAASERHVIIARAGDTLESILTALGLTAEDAGAIAALLTPRSWFGRNTFSGGEIITVLQDGAPGHARPLEVRLVDAGKSERVAALADNGAYVMAAPRSHTAAAAEATQDDMALRLSPDANQSAMKLDESLNRLAQDNRIAPSLIGDVMRLCAQDIDLDAAISAEDTAELLYSHNPEGNAELAFVALTLDGQTHRYYRFTAPDDGSTDYYDPDGYSVTASLMKQPVAGGRLGDGFGWRIHPILRDRRFHEGVDYAAPFGSPIAAAGAGVVEKIDQEWGYGKFVRIRHDFGYETTYAHLSGVPRGLKVGERIHPGQTIGFIGSTGLSTGPHLYYELRVNGHYADPLRAHLRAGRVLDGSVLAAFQRARARTDLLLQVSAQSAAAD
ncbi:MAG TPA: M23 family metallopeptidase [Xanthobacteraceae bacterium]|jgi:murein DD-endopeptidase MepM/ murein hydrolase activator NlpD